jgi:hypothetical protein
MLKRSPIVRAPEPLLPEAEPPERPGYRVRLDAEPLHVFVEGAVRPLRLARLSLADLTAIAEDGTGFAVGEQCRLRLPGVLGALSTVVVDRSPHPAGGAEVTLFFTDVTVENGLDLQTALIRLLSRGLALLPPRRARESETIRSRPRIRAMLRWLFAVGGEARLAGPGAGGIPLRAARFEPASREPLCFDVGADEWPAPPFSVEFLGHSSFFRFNAARSGRSGSTLALAMPDEMVRTRHRWQRRVAAPPDVYITFRHPQWPSLAIRRPVRDVSLDGIGVATNRLEDLLYPGLVVPEVVIEWQDRLRLEFQAAVRHVSARPGEPEAAGLALTPRRPEDRDHWNEELYRLLYPNTRMDGSFSRDLWRMFDRSGYFSLSDKKESDFEDLRDPFEAAGRRLARAPDLGCQVVWPSRRGIEATLSMLKIYDASTCLFHLARQRGRTPHWTSGRGILRDLYLHGLEHTLRDERLRWLIVWVQDVAHFSRLLHYDLPRRYLEDGRAHISQFHAMEGRCDRVPAPRPRGAEIGPATRAEIERLLMRLAAERAPAFLDAHDLVPERFDLVPLRIAWAHAGLLREREVLVAREGDRTAAAVLESADEGLHLFALFDCVHLFSVDGDARGLYPALLEAARAWYRGRGRRRFVYFAEGSDLAYATDAGFADLGGASLTLLPVALLPELIEQLYELTAPREDG